MKVNEELVNKLAHLARLEFEGEDKVKIIADLQNILGFMEKLEELNTEDVEPLIYMSDEKNVLRKDEVKQTITHKEALLNAPKKDSDYFRVPKVIDK